MKQLILSEEARLVIERLLSHGYAAYAVGGCVRDMLMGREPHDFDITTSALPKQVIGCFAGFRVLETGLKHGTVTVMVGKTPIEVTTFRQDGEYSDHRRPDTVHFTNDITQDLARRDFTINAMAYRPDTGVIDPFGGQDDIVRGTIRCVGVAQTRFEEDALRILRALRFASRFAFEIEALTAEAMLCLKDLLLHVAKERVLTELCGMDFAEIDARFLPVLQVVIPELSLICVRKGLPPIPAIRLAALLRGLDASSILKRFRAGNALTDRTSILVKEMGKDIPAEDIAIRRLLNRAGPEAAAQLFTLTANKDAQAVLERVLNRGDCYTLSMLAIKGDDLSALGFAGPAIGQTLEMLLALVIEGATENTPEALKTAARREI